MGKSEDQMGGVEAGDFEAGKYIGYKNINTFCPSRFPPFLESQSIRPQTDT